MFATAPFITRQRFKYNWIEITTIILSQPTKSISNPALKKRRSKKLMLLPKHKEEEEEEGNRRNREENKNKNL